MDWLHITTRPMLNDRYMITFPNLPLKLFLTEICSPYPDVNRHLIQFFRTHARPGDIILTTYDDLPAAILYPLSGDRRITGQYFTTPSLLIGWYHVGRLDGIAPISCKTPKNSSGSSFPWPVIINR